MWIFVKCVAGLVGASLLILALLTHIENWMRSGEPVPAVESPNRLLLIRAEDAERKCAAQEKVIVGQQVDIAVLKVNVERLMRVAVFQPQGEPLPPALPSAELIPPQAVPTTPREVAP
jgi:hypothetical protein